MLKRAGCSQAGGFIDRPSCVLDGCREQTVDGVWGWVSPSCVSTSLRAETSNRSRAIFKSLGCVSTKAVFPTAIVFFRLFVLEALFTQVKNASMSVFNSAVQSQSRSARTTTTWITVCLCKQQWQKNNATVNIFVSDYPFRYKMIFTTTMLLFVD